MKTILVAAALLAVAAAPLAGADHLSGCQGSHGHFVCAHDTNASAGNCTAGGSEHHSSRLVVDTPSGDVILQGTDECANLGGSSESRTTIVTNAGLLTITWTGTKTSGSGGSGASCSIRTTGLATQTVACPGQLAPFLQPPSSGLWGNLVP